MTRKALAVQGRRNSGFTLIELMIVVAVLAILASIAMPGYVDMLRKSKEGALRGNLGTLRSGLNIYYAEQEGLYPSCVVQADSSVLHNSLVPKYLDRIPIIQNGLHPPVSTVYCDWEIIPGAVHDSQGWYYDGALPQDPDFGGVWVACDHQDMKATSWTEY